MARFAYKKGYDIKILNYFERRMRKKLDEKLEKLNTQLEFEKAELKKLVLDAKQSYRILGFEPTETVFSFHLNLADNIIPKLEPLVTLNGQEIGYSKISKNTLQIHLRKYASTVDKEIVIGIGATKIPFKNPYLFRDTNENIKWQCEGHGDERVIFLPTSYLPNLFSDVIYEFELRIGRVPFGKFNGKFDKENECVLIYLGKDIQKSDMRGDKVAILSFLGMKIALPKPTIIYRDHQKVG